MQARKRYSRVFTILTAAILTLGVMAPALATMPAEAGDGVAQASDATANQQVAADNFAFATVTVQEIVDAFKAAVDSWTSCVADAAAANQDNEEGDVTNPLEAEDCGGSLLDYYEDGTPGNQISELKII